MSTPLILVADFRSLWNGRKIKHILDNGPTKLVIMNTNIKPEGWALLTLRLMIDTSALNESARTFMEENEIALQPYNVKLDYDYFSVGT